MLLRQFLIESNRIEGIERDLYPREIEAAKRFLRYKEIAVVDMISLVKKFQPDAVFRDKPGLNVRVGSHVAPPGGADVAEGLFQILRDLEHYSPYENHHKYERLHPFTDGNGRSGRMLWLWEMKRWGEGAPLGFLHTWYYQSLSAARG